MKIKENLPWFSANAMISLMSLVLIFIIFNIATKPKIKMSYKTKEQLSNTLYLNLKDGRVVIKMLPEQAPMHVQRITTLVRKGFYDGLTFHRVIEDFVAQGGDPKGDGTGGSGKKIAAEISQLKHKRGVVSMARGVDLNSADSQFFIVLDDQPYLDGKYTIWGHVIDGMEYVDNIKKGNPGLNGTVEDPDKIISMEIAIDTESQELSEKN